MKIFACTLLWLFSAGATAEAFATATKPAPLLTDSLKVIAFSNRNDTKVVDALNALARLFAYHAAVRDSVFICAERAAALADSLSYKRGRAEALNIIGYTLTTVGKIEQALEQSFVQLAFVEGMGEPRLIAQALFNIGFAAGQQTTNNKSEHQRARQYLLRGLALSQQILDSTLMAECCNALGRLSRKEGNIEEALGYHSQAVAFLINTNDNDIVASEQLGWALYSMGAIYEAQGKFPTALEYAQQSLAVRTRISTHFAVAVSLRLIARLYYKQGKYANALEYVNKSIAISNNLEGAFLVKSENYQVLSAIYFAMNKHEAALKWYKVYVTLKDSASALETQYSMLNLQTKLNVERQEREKAVLVKDREVQQAVIDRQRLLGVFIVGTGLILFALVLVLVRTNRIKQRKNQKIGVAYTEIRRQQEALQEQAQEIEITNTQLQETNTALQITNTALDEANTFKMNMLSMVSHDLKNPLNNIINYAGLVEEDADNTVQYVRNISQIGWRMLTFVEDLLDTAALELGKLEISLEPLNLSQLIREVEHRYAFYAAQKKQSISIETSDDCWIRGDEQRLRQVVDNLVSNAVKYAPRNTTITIGLQQGNNYVRLVVSDEGPGISEADKKQMFGFFQRLSAQPTGGESSSGVGLAIVKKLVEMMNGRVWCESELGDGLPSGATFIVELPRAEAKQ